MKNRDKGKKNYYWEVPNEESENSCEKKYDRVSEDIYETLRQQEELLHYLIENDTNAYKTAPYSSSSTFPKKIPFDESQHSDTMEPSPEDKYLQKEKISEIFHILSHWHPLHLNRFIDYVFLDKTISEIAEQEGCSQRTVYYSIHLTRKYLKMMLED